MQQEHHSKQDPPQAALCATKKHQSRQVPPSPRGGRWLPRGRFAVPVLTSSQKQMHTEESVNGDNSVTITRSSV